MESDLVLIERAIHKAGSATLLSIAMGKARSWAASMRCSESEFTKRTRERLLAYLGDTTSLDAQRTRERQALHSAVRRAGTVRTLARQIGYSHGHLYRVHSKHSAMSRELFDALLAYVATPEPAR